MISAWGAGSVYSPGKSFVPVGFRFTGTSTPPPAGSQDAITARSGGTIRNNYDGLVGFRFVAAANASVSQLGRWVVSGNSRPHTVQIMNSALTVLGSVTVNTSGATAGQIAYVSLASPVSLTAGQTYFVMCNEASGGDSWYDSNQTITENTAIISQMISAWGAGSVYSPGKSFVPVGFRFSSSTSSATPQAAILSRSGGTVRNNYDGLVGFRFVAAANATVTQLGRWVVSGNSRAHTVQIMNSALTVLGSVTVNTSGATAGQIAYVSLASPVSLTAGQAYFVMCDEASGGDSWYDYNQTISENTAIVSQMISAWGAGSVYSPGKSFVPVGFKFTIP